MEYLRYVYGPLEGRTACTAYYSATVVKLTNYNFPSPGWKIAIGSLSTSALAALKNLTYNQFGVPIRRQPKWHLGGDFLCIFFCVLRFY